MDLQLGEVWLGEEGGSCPGKAILGSKVLSFQNEKLTVPFGTAPCPLPHSPSPCQAVRAPRTILCRILGSKGRSFASSLLPGAVSTLSSALCSSPTDWYPTITSPMAQRHFPAALGGETKPPFPVNQILVSLLTALFLNGISPPGRLCSSILKCKMDKNPQPFS